MKDHGGAIACVMFASSRKRTDPKLEEGMQVICDGSIRICKSCADARREFALYRWDSSRGSDVPVKENDHAMDDVRYFVTTVMDGGSPVAIAAER